MTNKINEIKDTLKKYQTTPEYKKKLYKEITHKSIY